MMKTTVFRPALAGVLLLMLGCVTVPPSGNAPQALDERADAVLDGLVNAYETKDAAGFMALVSARYLDGYGDLQAALEDTLGAAVSATLDVRPERVWEDGNGMVLVDAAWDKTIMKNGAPGVVTTKGRVTLTFIRYNRDVLKLLSQKGDPVFP
jgi:hypothetical protein